MSVVYSKVIGDSCFGKSAIDEAIEKLESIPVSRKSVEKCKGAISDKVVDTWNENVQVMEQRMIKKALIEQYLKYMQNNYPGIDDKLREKYEGMIFGPWSTYSDDFKQNHGTTKTTYGQVNFGKDDDGSQFACVYAFYTAEMKFAEEIVKVDHPFLWGLIHIKTFEKKQTDLPPEDVEAIHDYFRFRALDGFLKTGVIAKINWVE